VYTCFFAWLAVNTYSCNIAFFSSYRPAGKLAELGGPAEGGMFLMAAI
jgi:hypothetical protein